MSNNSFTTICPICNEDSLNVNSENRPYNRIDSNCTNCWFYTYTKEWRSSLAEYLIDLEDEYVQGIHWDTEFNKQEAIDKYNSFSKENFNI